MITRHFSGSGRRDSNSRPQAWEARALPTELHPHSAIKRYQRPQSWAVARWRRKGGQRDLGAGLRARGEVEIGAGSGSVSRLSRAQPHLPTTLLRTLDLATPAGGEGGFLSAASGLAVVGGSFLVAADDEHHLGAFACHGADAGSLIRVMPGELPREPAERKRRKPDFEALVILPPFAGLTHGSLLVVGSGSTPQRLTAVVVELDARGALTDQMRHLDLTPLYETLSEHTTDLNVEGALVLGGDLVLLSRANGTSPDNHIARYPLAELAAWLDGAARPVAPSSVTAWRIGEIDGVPLGVTDGAPHPGGGWVFSAAAEDTSDSYNDGELVGAAVGVIDARGHLAFLARLAPTAKVEGIVASIDDGRTVLHMVTDADDPTRAAELLGATLPG